MHVTPAGSVWTGARPRRIVLDMNDSSPCALCGDDIDVGQAWMEADREGARIRAHAGCVYRDEAGGDDGTSWEPQEEAVS